MSEPGSRGMENNIYITVMGTMGSGKTTVAGLIAQKLKFQLLEENFGDNAFLPRFYKDMKRWAFHSQTFFLMEKTNQMLETRSLLVKKSIVQDTPIQQDVFSYAKAQHILGNIDDAEWKLYLKIYHSFEPYFPKPKFIVYLKTTVNELKRRIVARGRGYEQAIPRSYIELLDRLNQEWLSEIHPRMVLTIETDGFNIVRSPKAQGELVEAVRRKIHTYG